MSSETKDLGFDTAVDGYSNDNKDVVADEVTVSPSQGMEDLANDAHR